MSLFMTQFAYAPEARAALLHNPHRVAARLERISEHQAGSRLVSLSFCFGLGEYDGVLTFEATDDMTATAVLLAALSSSRHVKDSKTTKLLTPEEFTEALRAGELVTSATPESRLS